MKFAEIGKWLAAFAFFVLFGLVTLGVGVARQGGTFAWHSTHVTDGDNAAYFE